MDPTQNHGPLIFVHIGNALPKHALSSFRRSARLWPGKTVVLLNQSAIPARVHGLPDFQAIEDFYDGMPLADARLPKSWDNSFRDGFLRKCLERFFVLDQYCRWAGVASFFHAETDVLTSSVPDLERKLDLLGQGIFIPRDDVDRAIGSLIYVNSGLALQEFVRFVTTGRSFSNEMEALAAFIDAKPGMAFALPTIRYWEATPPLWPTISPEEIGAIFDAAALGQWVLGIDPRNSLLPVRNHFRNERHKSTFSEMTLRYSLRQNLLTVQVDRHSSIVPLANLHVHSKKLQVFQSDLFLLAMVKASNLPFGLFLEFSPVKWARMVHRLAREAARRVRTEFNAHT